MSKSIPSELKGRAIVTYGRSLMAVVIAHSLGKRGIDVISCDSVGMTAAQFSKHTRVNFVHPDPEDGEDAYIAGLNKHIEKYAPEPGVPYVLIPGFRDAKLLSRHKDKLSPKITLAAPDYDAINKVDPKHHLFEYVKDRDVAAPLTFHPQNPSELSDALDEIELPALIKAVDNVGGRGIDFFERGEEVEMAEKAKKRTAEENPPPLIQQAAKGKDYCFCALLDKGQIKAHMAYHNIQTKPSKGGAGAMRETIEDERFIRAAQNLLGDTGWTGIAQMDFMWTGEPEDEPLLIEVNPRFWAGLFQSVESGVDFPWLLYHLFAHGDVPEGAKVKIGTKTRLPGIWAAGALREALTNKIDFDGAEAAWDETWEHAKKGEFKSAFTDLKTAFSKITDFDDAIAFLKQQNSSAKQARSELMLGEDPATSLGVFFILSSLVRHGELPPEVR